MRLLLPCCSLFDLPVCFRVILVWIGITKAQPFWRAYANEATAEAEKARRGWVWEQRVDMVIFRREVRGLDSK